MPRPGIYMACMCEIVIFHKKQYACVYAYCAVTDSRSTTSARLVAI